MPNYEIPLTPGQAQRLSISLNNVTYVMKFRWMAVDQGGWVVDLYNSLDEPIVTGIPLVTGTDLLGQFEYLGIAGALVIQSDADPDAVPTYANLGNESHLYFIQAD